MKLQIGYIIKSFNNKKTVIRPIWKKKNKYKKIQLNIQKNYVSDNRTELFDNVLALIKVDSYKKRYYLIKILN